MLELKTAIVTFLLGTLLSGTAVWNYQKNKYNALIAKDVSVRTAELAKVTETVIKQERINSALTNKLDQVANDAERKRNQDAATIARLLRAANGVLPGATVCEAPTGTPSGTSGSTEAKATEGRLSAEFQDYLAEVLRRADEAADYAAIGYEYAQQINRQRERMIMESE